MHVKIVVTDDEGQTFEGEADLAPAGTRRAGARRSTRTSAPAQDAKMNFNMPLRAFLKKHATGGGPRKFVVLLAHLTKGKTGVPITRDAVEKAWAQNKGVLGGAFQDMYTTRAKGEGWTDSPKRGTFVLHADWRGALK